MSLLINGVEMPKNYKQLSATLDRQIDDGILRLFVYDFDSEAMKYSCRVYPIVEVPTPHGRLIDADRLMEVIERNSYTLINYCNSKDRGMFLCGIRQAIDEAPTIIEAEE